MMQIIPVIDLLNGTVVHAKQGNRKNYQAIQSQLTSSCKPLDVVSALLDYYPFQHLYIADLNAIQQLNGVHSSNYNVIEAITQRFPTLNTWIDAGISKPEELTEWQQFNFRLVLGSESFTSLDDYLAMNTNTGNSAEKTSNYVLSLDFMPHGYHGPIELMANSHHWPQDVILMALTNVGSNLGANMTILDAYKKYTTDFNLYAAGGIRNIHDLSSLKLAGFSGALVATALHQKQITYTQLEDLLK